MNGNLSAKELKADQTGFLIYLWMIQSSYFPDFQGWGEGYAAFTYSYKEKEVLINYIEKSAGAS